jgi:hypothetical protein
MFEWFLLENRESRLLILYDHVRIDTIIEAGGGSVN